MERNIGVFQWMVEKLVPCLDDRGRHGVFYTSLVIAEIVGLVLEAAIIWLLADRGYFREGILLILVKAMD